jgi:hypothetical protein
VIEWDPGMRNSERTVAIKDIQGRREYLRVPLGFLEIVGEVFYVPVGLVYEDPGRQVSLIELPQEGECGNWRLWVHSADLLHANGTSP